MLLPKFNIKTVIDVGANVGQFASQIRQLSRSVKIHSFEPNPKVFKKLSKTASSDSLWFVHEAALGRSNGDIILNVTASDDFSSCLDSTEFGKGRFASELVIIERVAVKLQTLDYMMKRIIDGDNCDEAVLLKLDTQGYDMEVLKGGASLLGNVQIIVTELSFLPIYEGVVPFDESMAYLKSLGFMLTGLFPVSRDANYRIIEADCVFAKTAL